MTITYDSVESLPDLNNRSNPFGNGIPEQGAIYAHAYSGVDAKIVVHLPQRQNDRQENPAVAETEEEIRTLEESLETTEDAEERSRILAEIDTLGNTMGELLRTAGPREGITVALAEIQTISWSLHREKGQVRTLGSVYPRSITRGPRCLPATEKVLVKHKGFISISEVEPGDYVQSSDSTYDKVLGSWYQGEKLCYKMSLENGYTLVGSYDHPISTSEGWINMEDLEKDDLVDVVGKTPVSDEDYPISDQILKLIALLIGDGQIQKYKNTHVLALSIADKEMDSIGSLSEQCLKDLNISFKDSRKNEDKCIKRSIGICETGKGQTDWRKREYNELHKWLLRFNMYGQHSHQKEIPQELIVGMSERQVVEFLRYLFSTDGCYSVSHDDKKKYIEAKYTSTSEALIDQIRLLLSKIGISSIKNKNSRLRGQVGGRSDIISRHNAHTLVISSSFDLLRFYQRVGILGKDIYIKESIPVLKRRINNQSLDISVKELQAIVKNYFIEHKLEVGDFFQKHNLYSYNRDLTPRRAFKIVDELNDPSLLRYIEESVERLLQKEYDYIPRRVLEIQKVGLLPVYDLEVENRHAFIANFIRVHNTISGSIVFTLFQEHMFARLFEALQVRSTGVGDMDYYTWSSFLSDQLPPVNASIIFSNEYGNISQMAILGMDFMNEGGVISIEDLFIEGTMQYIARDIDLIHGVANRTRPDNGISLGTDLTGTRLLNQEIREGTLGRRNPFV